MGARILLATDGSAGALDAARLLTTLSLGSRARIILLAVGTPEKAQAHLAATAALLSPSVDVERHQRDGAPADEILRAEAEFSPDLLVLGSAGLTRVARFWVGSVADRVIREARGSVLIVWPRTRGLRRAVLSLETPTAVSGMLSWLQRCPLLQDTEVEVVHFVTSGHLLAAWRRAPFAPARAVLRALERREVRRTEQDLAASVAALRPYVAAVEARVRSSDAVAGIAALADHLNADLLVVAERGRPALPGLTREALAQLVANRDRSILVIRAPATPEAH